MKRTTVMIPHDLKIRAARHAKMMGISLGQFVFVLCTSSESRSNRDERMAKNANNTVLSALIMCQQKEEL